MDFTIFYKEIITDDFCEAVTYDYFYSGFDGCDRTKKLYKKIQSKNKLWFYFPEYDKLDRNENVDYYYSQSHNEADYFDAFIQNYNIASDAKVCIDITGFLRPHFIFLIRLFQLRGMSKVDVIYTEPQQYKNSDETAFSGFVDNIRSVSGFSSLNISSKSDNDLLIISAGYDDDLIAKTVQFKDCKNKYLIIGFPSLQPDMYQENILRIESIKNSLGEINIKYVPASDPFVTAQIIKEIVEEQDSVGNVHLSPLSTKPQALGMMLYFIYNYMDQSVNIIYPYTNKCYTGSAVGIKRSWRYEIEFPID